jgi:hypothetical protein
VGHYTWHTNLSDFFNLFFHFFLVIPDRNQGEEKKKKKTEGQVSQKNKIK